MSKDAMNVVGVPSCLRPVAETHDVHPGTKRTDVGPIPEEWSTRSLGELGRCLIGLTYEPRNVRPEGLLVLRASNIGDDGLQFGDDVFVDVEVPEELLVQPNDLLICARNGSRPLIGKSTILDGRTKGMTFGAFMSVFRSNDSRFVAYCFGSHIIKHQVRQHLGATINQITKKSLNSFRVPFPRSSERRAIVGVLSDVDGLLRSLNALIAKKRAIQTAMAQQLLTGRVRLPGFGEAWRTVKLGSITHIETGSRNNHDKVADGEYPFFVRSSKVERINTFSFDGEGILIPGEGQIGNVIHYVKGRFDVHQRVYLIAGFDHAVLGKFVYYVMSRFFYWHAMTHTVKATVDSLRLPTFKTFTFSIPKTTAEQLAITTVLSDSEVEIETLEQRRDKTRALKRGMMQELLTGRTRLVEPLSAGGTTTT